MSNQRVVDVHSDDDVIEIRRDVRIPTSADPTISLSADIYLPKAPSPVPALVMVVPYRNDTYGIFWESTLRWFAERGYACVLVDERGFGSSDGSPSPPWEQGEIDDAVTAVQWTAAQAWCTGHVGMWGQSHGGFTAMGAAIRQLPELKAIMPIMAALDVEYDAMYPGGARADMLSLGQWAGYMLSQQLLPPLYDHKSVRNRSRWRGRLNDTEPYLMDFARHRPGDPAWKARRIDPESITVPALFVGGWHDVNCDATVRAFEHAKGPKRLLMGPWMHATTPQESPTDPIEFFTLALHWWDQWLTESPSRGTDDDPVAIYVQGDSAGWRGYPSWPAAQQQLSLTVDDEFALRDAADVPAATAAKASYEYLSDPTVGAFGGLWGFGMSFGLPLDQHQDDARSLSFDSQPLSDGMLVIGRPEVSVRISDDAFRAFGAPKRLVARLTDVDPHGRSTLITVGVVCPQDDQPEIPILLRAAAYQLPAGHRLRIALSDSDFPRLTPLPELASLHVASIEVNLPTAPRRSGHPIDIPAPARSAPSGSDANQSAGPYWRISQLPIRDAIEICYGSKYSAPTPDRQHWLESSSEVLATVRRTQPEAAAVTGNHSTTVHASTGELIRVQAEIRCTQTDLWARGTVSVDGTMVFEKIWEAPLA